MKTKPITPYQRLLKSAQDFARRLNTRHTETMFIFPKNRLSEGWTLKEVYERAQAAETLGYEVIVRPIDNGLRLEYVKKIPSIPWEFRT